MDEKIAIKTIVADAIAAKIRAKATAAHLAGLRNLAGPLAIELADDLTDLGLQFETIANNLRGATRVAAAGLAR